MKTIIIDDNTNDIAYLAENLDVINVVKTFKTGEITIDEITELDVDVIFMNIHSPQCINIELLQFLANHQLAIHIVFITLKSISQENMLYIKKPFMKEDIFELRETLLQEKNGSNNQVQICMFKYFHFKSDDEKFYNVKWRTAKSKELLVYLLQHSGEIVRKDVLVELLWPDITVEKAYDNLYATIYYLRKLLKELEINITINNTVQGYEVQLHQIATDIEQFEEQVRNIEYLLSVGYDKTLILSEFKKLQKLYTGEYLEEETYVWKEHKKEEYGIKFLALSQKIIDLFIEHEEYTEAILLALHLQKLYPYMDYPFFILMKLYSKFGDPYNVEKQYMKLKEMLDQEFSAEPSVRIRKWYQEWIKVQNI